MRPKSLVQAALKAGISLTAWASATVLSLAALYGGATLVLGIIPVNRGFTAPAEGVEIFVRSNGIHTDLVLPVVNAVIDWRTLHPARDFGPPLRPLNTTLSLEADHDPSRNPRATHIAFGWGDQGFYFETPYWTDLKPGIALNAFSGRAPSAMHVEYLARPATGPRMRRLVITSQQYRALAAYVQAGFIRDAEEKLKPFPGRGYTLHDTFYAARDSYGPFLTCNEWTRRGLAAAGVRVPVWTPLPWGLMTAPEKQ